MGLPTPNNRYEKFLNAIATGDTSSLPTPITREEAYLYYIALNGGGGGGGTGDVTGVKGAAESTYRKGNVNITPQNIGLPTNAQANVIEHIYANGVEVVPQNKGVYLTLLEQTVNNLTNYYLKSDTYTKAEVNTIVGNMAHLTLSIVDSLPVSEISTTTIYLIETAAGSHVYTQYAYIDNAWAQLGTTQVDLTNYYTKTEVDAKLLLKQDVLTFDATPTASSTNPVESGGVYSALQGKQDTLTFDNAPTANSANPVKSGGVYTALEGKQDVMQVSTMPSVSEGAGKVYQYVGTTTQDFTHGYFYEVQNGAWANVTVQDGGGVGGGHVIEDAAGNEMAQEDNLQFGGYLRTSDDAQNGRTVVTDEPELVEWSTWITKSAAEKQGHHWKITNAPYVDGTIDADLLTKLWENPNPNASFAAQDINFSSSDYDFLLVDWGDTQYHHFSTIVPRTGNMILSYTVTTSSQHITVNSRELQYSNGSKYVAFDGYSQNSDGTKVIGNILCIPKAIYGIKKTVKVKIAAIAGDVSTSADKCMLSDGVTSVQDAHDGIEVASVTADGVKTYSALLDELYALLPDLSTLTHSVLRFNSGSIFDLPVNYIAAGSSGNIRFGAPRNNGSNGVILYTVRLLSSGSNYNKVEFSLSGSTTSTVLTPMDSTVLSSGVKISVIKY